MPSSSPVRIDRADGPRPRARARDDSAQRPAAKVKTRSRNGCSQCKTKRLKCDEAKPECMTCINNNRKCPGYGRAFRWSTKHEKTLDFSHKNYSSGPREKDNDRNSKPSPKPLERRQQDSGYEDASDAHDIHQDNSPVAPSDGVEFQDAALLAEDVTVSSASPNCDGWVNPQYDLMVNDLSLLHDFWAGDATGLILDDGFTSSAQQSLFQLPQPDADSTSLIPFALGGPSSSFLSHQSALPSVPRSLCDYSNVLVEEWFRHVCPIFSSFDSQANLNRTLAQESWTRSASVMHCLQSMAAICLSTQMPHMKNVAQSHLAAAVVAIQADLGSLRSLPSGELPTDVLLALCCIGTTACWVDTKEIGVNYLKEAKTLLKRINQDAKKLSLPDLQKLSFFNNSLVYWNMLVAVVSDDQDDLGIPKPKKPSGVEAAPIIPHPWTGISVSAQLLFMQAIRLCRRFRLRHTSTVAFTMSNLQSALGEIEEAQRVEEELLGLDQYEVGEISETGDKLSPKAHFIYVAEAYRLASLLQLYQTFPDLVARRLPEDARDTSGYVPWDKWIVPLCLRLVNILRKIPVSSRTRCIQPLLYISASSGLRFDVDALMPDRGTLERQAMPSLSELKGLPAEVIGQELRAPEVTKLSIEITHARRFILGRLSMLEHSLPPAPIIVAKDLIKAIWAAYDLDTSRLNYTHWIDVMESLDLRTIFG